jgi:hypothetical protein
MKVSTRDEFPLQGVKKKYRVDPSRIYFVKFILEAYDNMAQLTTLDPDLGLIEIFVAPGFGADFDCLLADLKGRFRMEPWSGPETGKERCG